MAYKPIVDAAGLPPVGPFPEHQRLDIKTRVPASVLETNGEAEKLEDLAIDLAAFANASGGVVLVGASEDPRNVLKEYVTMSEADAAKVVGIFGRKARALCSPQPIIDARAIERDTGAYVVAVNIDAYAAPPIGVRPSNATNDRPRWWSFPIRRGTDNVPARPEELATIMDPRLRRVALQLDRFLRGERKQIHVSSATGAAIACDLISVDADAGIFVVVTQSNHSITLPLDRVDAVWRDQGAAGRQCVAMQGRIESATHYATYYAR